MRKYFRKGRLYAWRRIPRITQIERNPYDLMVETYYDKYNFKYIECTHGAVFKEFLPIFKNSDNTYWKYRMMINFCLNFKLDPNLSSSLINFCNFMENEFERFVENWELDKNFDHINSKEIRYNFAHETSFELIHHHPDFKICGITLCDCKDCMEIKTNDWNDVD